MFNAIRLTKVYNDLCLNIENSNSHLFYSSDPLLNNEIALTFAKSILCESKSACGKCESCLQIDKKTNPDCIVLDQPSIKVEDVNNLVSKLGTKPISYSKKVFVILNADNINEIAQNKLLKSLEEPNEDTVFILSTSKTDKLLPTVMSRLNKHFVPRLTSDDKLILKKDFSNLNIDINNYLIKDISLSQIVDFEKNEEYKQSLKQLEELFNNLNSSKDIPIVLSKINANKNFLQVLEDVFFDCINETHIYPSTLTNLINYKFKKEVLVKSIPHIEMANKHLLANVNISYILDNLMFKILKEKFLCK